jgi:hypothetical protein
MKNNDASSPSSQQGASSVRFLLSQPDCALSEANEMVNTNNSLYLTESKSLITQYYTVFLIGKIFSGEVLTDRSARIAR